MHFQELNLIIYRWNSHIFLHLSPILFTIIPLMRRYSTTTNISSRRIISYLFMTHHDLYLFFSSFSSFSFAHFLSLCLSLSLSLSLSHTHTHTISLLFCPCRTIILFDEIEEFCLDRENPALGRESRMLTTAMLTQVISKTLLFIIHYYLLYIIIYYLLYIIIYHKFIFILKEFIIHFFLYYCKRIFLMNTTILSYFSILPFLSHSLFELSDL